MSIFRRLTGKHGEKSGSDLQVSGKDHPRTTVELAKQGLVGPLFEKLIEGGLPQLNELHDSKQSLLHIAAEHGHKPVVKLLLLHSAVAVDQVDAHGNTPLLLACLHKRLEVIDFLLRKHADVKHANSDGVTALHFLARQPMSEQTQTVFEALLQLGADKEAKDKFGESPLQRASATLNSEVVQWLLSRDVDINSVNQFGETSLHKVTRMLHADEDKAIRLIELLLQKGANPDIAGEHGTPAQVASKKTCVPHLQELFTKAKERRAEKQNKLMAVSATPSRLMDLPVDWASRDSKQRSSYLLQKWGTLKKAKENAQSGTPVPPEIAVSEAPTEAIEEEMMPLGSPRETQNLSATLLLDESEKKELKLSAETASPPPASPIAGGICSSADGYRVEEGSPRDRPISPRHMVLDFPPEPYKKTYVQQKHWNFVGYLNVVGEEKKEPAAISILMRVNEELGFTSCAALIRTQLGVVELPMRPPTSTAPMDLLNTLMMDKTRFNGNPQFHFVDNPELIFEFLEYEKNDPQRCTSLPIGIIYVPRANMSHLEIWDSSNQSSDAFDQFLHVLGDRITLQGWSGYAGGLDTVYDKKGKFSVYTRWRGLEIMFHVATLLPYNSADHAKVQIARVIGNDITNVVFYESNDGKYSPATFNSAVTHVYGVVHPTPNGAYRTAFASKAFVPKFGPELPPEIAKEQFKDYFLTKLVNGHFASQRSKGLNMMYSRPREVLLRALVEQFEQAAPTLALPTETKNDRRASDKKEKEERKRLEKEKEKAAKEAEKAEKDRLQASSKVSRRKSVEIQQQPLKQLLSDAQKEKDKEAKEKEKLNEKRKNSPAPTRDRRMSHGESEQDGSRLTPSRSQPPLSDSPGKPIEASRSEGGSLLKRPVT